MIEVNKMMINEEEYLDITFSELSNKKSCCYFCDYDKNVHKHHIIPKKNGGNNTWENFLTLCPNHHYLIHKKDWFLLLKNHFYYLIKQDKSEILKPFKFDKEHWILQSPDVENMELKGLNTKNNE